MQDLHSSSAADAPLAEETAPNAQRERERESAPRVEVSGPPNNRFANPFRFEPQDVLAAHYQQICDKGKFQGTDDADIISSHRLALRIYSELPTEWKQSLGAFNEPRPCL